jgi:acetyl-CoA synthetase
MLPRGATYEEIARAFRWQVPARFNIGVACSDVWADGSGRTALIHLHADGRVERISFDALKSATNRLANALRAQGIGVGDRIGVLLPQVPEAAIAHLAAYKLGAIAWDKFPLLIAYFAGIMLVHAAISRLVFRARAAA